MSVRGMMSPRSPLVFILLLLLSTVLLGLFYSHLLTQDIVIDIGSFDDEGYVQGFYARENVSTSPYRWSSGRSSLLFPNRGRFPFTISLAADAPRPEGQSQPDYGYKKYFVRTGGQIWRKGRDHLRQPGSQCASGETKEGQIQNMPHLNLALLTD